MSTEPEPNLSPAPPSDPPSLVNSSAPAVEEPKPGEEVPKVEEPAVEPPQPLTMEALKLPEGFTVDEAVSTDFLSIMNDDKLTGAERAQKLVDMQASLLTKAAEANYEAWSNMQTQWQDEVRTDPEIGGAKLEPTLGEISKLVDKYGSPELRQAMDLTGAGNNPHIVRFLAKVAKDLSEGGPVSGAPPQAKEALADRMYPSMKPKQGA